MIKQAMLGCRIFTKPQLATEDRLSKFESTAVIGFQEQLSYHSKKSFCVTVKVGLFTTKLERKCFIE